MDAHAKILEWFDRYGRHDLPWRKTKDPYKIYVSEVMLQQTQVERVKEYYERFLRRFPTLQSLARSEIDEVLALWSGLGYYKRARSLHATAKLCGDELPKSYDELIALPGIGDYTASAICSFAYNQPVAVTDTNISRLLGRLFATRSPKPFAKEFLNTRRPKEHNLALMDIGATICTPKDPACDRCPLVSFCLGKDRLEEFTRRRASKRSKMDLHLCFWVQEGALALTRSKESLYEGLLTLPEAHPSCEPIARFRHSYTKYDLTIRLYRQKPHEAVEWVELRKIQEAPVNAIVTKALKLLSS